MLSEEEEYFFFSIINIADRDALLTPKGIITFYCFKCFRWSQIFLFLRLFLVVLMLTIIDNSDAQLNWKLMKSWNWAGIEPATSCLSSSLLYHWATSHIVTSRSEIGSLLIPSRHMYCKYFESAVHIFIRNQLFHQHKTEISLTWDPDLLRITKAPNYDPGIH